jgi:hypothetical protein
MVERIDNKHPLAKYFVLYDKKTMRPMLDPCFSEYSMLLECGHERSLFSDKYTEPSYCDECHAMRKVKKFEFVGVTRDLIDFARPFEIQIRLKEWDCESKSGQYFLMRPHKMPNGKYIAHVDYMAAPNFGTFSEEEIKANQEKVAEVATANYSDQQSVTVFEVPEYALNVPLVVECLKRYSEIPDVIAVKMIQREQKGDGTFNWEMGDQIDVAKLKMPQPTEINS